MKLRFRMSYHELPNADMDKVIDFLNEHELEHVVSGNTIKLTCHVSALVNMDVPTVRTLFHQRSEPDGELRLILYMFLGYDMVVTYGFYSGWAGVEITL